MGGANGGGPSTVSTVSKVTCFAVFITAGVRANACYTVEAQ